MRIDKLQGKGRDNRIKHEKRDESWKKAKRKREKKEHDKGEINKFHISCFEAFVSVYEHYICTKPKLYVPLQACTQGHDSFHRYN